jgi:hypothetical protein
VAEIAKELTAGEIAAQIGMPEGPPAHVGTMPGQGNPPPGSPQASGPSPEHDAAVGQGTRQGPIQAQGGPQTHLTGSQPAGGQHPISPGIGG